MNSFKAIANAYFSELITALVVLTISFLIISDGRFIFIFSALAVSVVLAFFALKFPTVPLYLLVILGLGDQLLYEVYEFRWSGLQVLPTDPVYVIMFLTMILSVVRDPGVVGAYWKNLRGGVFLGLCFLILIVLGYQQRGYSALAEFRFQFIALFIPFYCLSARLTTMDWIRFLRRAFWLSLLVVLPLVASSVIEGARPFSPGHRVLGAEDHLWLMFSLFLIAVPGLICNGLVPTLLAWLVGGSYLLLILSDGHRSVWLTFLSILVVIWFLDRGEFRRLRIIAALLGLAVLPLIALVVLEGQTEIAEFIVSRTKAYFSPSADATASWRLQLWGAAWQIVKEHPVMGIGLGNYFGDVWFILTGDREGPSLHNLYMTLLLKGGFVLAATYVWYVSSIAGVFLRLRKQRVPGSDTFTTLGLAILAGTLVFQIPYGANMVLMLFVGSLLGAALAVSRENDQGRGT